LTLLLLLAGCSGAGGRVSGPPLPQRELAARAAIDELRAGHFAEAAQRAAAVIGVDRDNPYARIVSGIARYRATLHQLRADLMTLAMTAFRGAINFRYLRTTLEQAERDLASVDEDLAVAARFPELTLDLCISCWEKIDWNGNGRIDSRDGRFLEIELDAEGKEIPEGDPRRRPVFRFDAGDLHWARAFVAFQRALLDLALAYRWSDAQGLIEQAREGLPRGGGIVIGLEQPARIASARRQLLEGLGYADAARRAYLAETDDEREWLPNPRQKNHPLPLPVDDALYQTWEGVVGDLKRLLEGTQGLSVAELAQLGDHQWKQPPRGFIDLGRLLSQPRAINIDLGTVMGFAEGRREDRETSPEPVLRAFLGDCYRDRMTPSPLIGRMRRMKDEVTRGKESLDRKLRYLFWLN
jgi:hypothetical protein